jgi:hypothetical protein
MTKVRKFVRLDSRERRIVVEAAVSVVFVRILLTILPFRLVRRLSGGRTRPAPMRASERNAVTPAELANAVVRVSRSVPRATCLTQALALDGLLRRHGHAGKIRIGVAKDTGGALTAHAWVESDGSVLIGGDEAARFTPLTQ